MEASIKNLEAIQEPEEWRVIPSWPGYEASSWGRIRRNGVIRSIYINKQQQRRKVELWINGKRFVRSASILIAEAFLGPRPLGHDVHHKDENKLNDFPTNLEYKDNKRHRCYHTNKNIAFLTSKAHLKSSATGKIMEFYPCMKGELNGRAKLKEAEVLEIRKLYAKGLKIVEIAAMYPIAPCSVSQIVNNRCWKHLTPKTDLHDKQEIPVR